MSLNETNSSSSNGNGNGNNILNTILAFMVMSAIVNAVCCLNLF